MNLAVNLVDGIEGHLDVFVSSSGDEEISRSVTRFDYH